MLLAWTALIVPNGIIPTDCGLIVITDVDFMINLRGLMVGDLSNWLIWKLYTGEERVHWLI